MEEGQQEEIASVAWEQETIINFNEDEPEAQVYTASKRVANLLMRRGFKPCQVDKQDGKPCAWTFTQPKTAVLLKPANRIIRLGGSRKISSIASSVAPGEEVEQVSRR